ncbi:MAG: tetratricopeptide repeat protein [Phycisphaeraceae bacterium]|nr:MAG: tetratricopeptide repeat protein [Phycisphaeraceae bacterium]
MSHDPLDTVIGVSESTHRDPQTASKHAAAGAKAEQAGDRPAAVIEYRKAVAADPFSADALFKLAYSLDLLGEEDEALACYERAVEQPPANVNALINLAVVYEDRGDYLRAERCLRQVLETNPNHPRALLYMKDVQASRDMVIEEEPDRDHFKRKALMDTPVTDFELSVRARTCLKKMSIRTLGDLLKITEAELMSYKNFGESSLVEIKKMLTARGLRLGQGMEDAHRAARKALADQFKGSTKEGVLNKPVGELQMSVRARKALQLLNIATLGDLASHTEAELMGVKNFGATSLKEVRERLAEHGLALRTLEA